MHKEKQRVGFRKVWTRCGQAGPQRMGANYSGRHRRRHPAMVTIGSRTQVPHSKTGISKRNGFLAQIHSTNLLRARRSTPRTQAAQPGQRRAQWHTSSALGRLWFSRPQYYSFPGSRTALTGAGCRSGEGSRSPCDRPPHSLTQPPRVTHRKNLRGPKPDLVYEWRPF